LKSAIEDRSRCFRSGRRAIAYAATLIDPGVFGELVKNDAELIITNTASTERYKRTIVR